MLHQLKTVRSLRTNARILRITETGLLVSLLCLPGLYGAGRGFRRRNLLGVERVPRVCDNVCRWRTEAPQPQKTRGSMATDRQQRIAVLEELIRRNPRTSTIEREQLEELRRQERDEGNRVQY